MMRLLTQRTDHVTIAANDESVVIASHDVVMIACLHCGGMKQGYLIYTPGTQMHEYNMKRDLLNQQVRCLCNGRKQV